MLKYLIVLTAMILLIACISDVHKDLRIMHVSGAVKITPLLGDSTTFTRIDNFIIENIGVNNLELEKIVKEFSVNFEDSLVRFNKYYNNIFYFYKESESINAKALSTLSKKTQINRLAEGYFVFQVHFFGGKYIFSIDRNGKKI